MKVGDVKILLVDNHQMMRRGLRQLLETKPGLTVAGEASSLQSGMAQARISAPDLVLLNLNPPREEDGVESARHLLAEFPPVKVIVLASHAELEFVLRALRAGVSGYVVNDNAAEELFRAIQAVMDFCFYLSPEVSAAVLSHFLKSARGWLPAPSGAVLSDRERWLLQLIAEGKRNKEIADELAVTVKSAETYRYRLMKKLDCGSVAELVRFAVRQGIVEA
jgi:two-component system response regulator NreC